MKKYIITSFLLTTTLAISFALLGDNPTNSSLFNNPSTLSQAVSESNNYASSITPYGLHLESDGVSVANGGLLIAKKDASGFGKTKLTWGSGSSSCRISILDGGAPTSSASPDSSPTVTGLQDGQSGYMTCVNANGDKSTTLSFRVSLVQGQNLTPLNSSVSVNGQNVPNNTDVVVQNGQNVSVSLNSSGATNCYFYKDGYDWPLEEKRVSLGSQTLTSANTQVLSNLSGKTNFVYFCNNLSNTVTRNSADFNTLSSFFSITVNPAYVPTAGGTQNPGVGASCFIPGNILTVGKNNSVTNGEVSKLQNFLAGQRDANGNPYFTVGITDYFGSITQAALISFQNNNGLLPANGVVGGGSPVGDNTKNKIAEISCGGAGSPSTTSQSFPTPVLSVNNANPTAGETVTFSWSSPTLSTCSWSRNGQYAGALGTSPVSLNTTGLSGGYSLTVSCSYNGQTKTSNPVVVNVNTTTTTATTPATGATSLNINVNGTAYRNGDNSIQVTSPVTFSGWTGSRCLAGGVQSSPITLEVGKMQQIMCYTIANTLEVATVYVTVATQATNYSNPVLSVSNANPTAGDTVTFSWTNPNGSGCYWLRNGQYAGALGTSPLSVNTTGLSGGYSLTMTCSYPGGQTKTSSPVTINVSTNTTTTQSFPTPVLSVNNANPTAGETVTFSWSSPTLSTCSWSRNGQYAGALGTSPVSLNTTGLSGSYSLTVSCSYNGQTKTSNPVVVNVNTTTTTAANYSNPVLSVSNANPTAGDSITFNWTNTGATSCSSNLGSNTSLLSGNSLPFNTAGLNGSYTVSVTCTYPNNITKNSNSVTVNVTPAAVTPAVVAPPVATCGTINGLTVSDYSGYTFCSTGVTPTQQSYPSTTYGRYQWNCGTNVCSATLSAPAVVAPPVSNCGTIDGRTVSDYSGYTFCATGVTPTQQIYPSTPYGRYQWNCGTNVCSAILSTSTTAYYPKEMSRVLGAQTACVNIPRNMHRGAENNNVKNLQTFLIKKGYLSEAETGFYGDKTVEAVKDYQASKGLPQTGMVYDFTRSSIKNETCQ